MRVETADDRGLWVHRGTSAVLFVAPHGGRRPPVDADAPPPKLRVNDVYTPEVTRLAAGPLRAGWVINATHDRNALDLNRMSQVRQRAPWFLAHLTEEIAAILARHETAEIVFVHGWNVGQAKCDIGIGGVEAGGGVSPVNRTLTVSDDYLHRRVACLRAACAASNIAAPVGEHYPGSHRNNLLQLFGRDYEYTDCVDARRIQGWVREGRVNALQLELGIPLRWPGPWRERFIEALISCFKDQITARSGASAGSLRIPHPTRSTPPAALQFYDAAADVGMFAGLGPMSAHTTGGRLLLFLGGQRVALFTGEDAGHGRATVAPLDVARDADTTRLRFDGAMLLLGDAALYLDLEAALAASRVVSAQVELTFRCMRRGELRAAEFGTVEGQACVDGRRIRIATAGFGNAGALRAAGLKEQTMLAATFGLEQAVLSRSEDGHTEAVHFAGMHMSAQAGARLAITTDGDCYTPARLNLAANGIDLEAEPLSRMSILRPAGNGYLRVTFGVAQFRWGDAHGAGMYEHACPVMPATSDRAKSV